jgi:hypothetical protein
MRNSKKHGIKSLIILLVTIIFTSSFLLFELGVPLKGTSYVSANGLETYSEFLHRKTLRSSSTSKVSPSITVLNHGYTGGPSAWYTNNADFKDNSLTERLRTSLNADIYIMGVRGEKDDDTREYVQYPVGYVDEKYDAGNDRYTDGNGRKAQEIGLTNKN